MNIPKWVDSGKRKNIDKARARLRYMLAVLAAKHTGRQSMRGLAEKVKLDHSTLSTYIRRGSFSVPAANRIVEALATTEVTESMLIDPLTHAKPTEG